MFPIRATNVQSRPILASITKVQVASVRPSQIRLLRTRPTSALPKATLSTPQTSCRFTRMASTGTQATLPSPGGQWKNTELSAIRYGPGCLKTALPAAIAEDLDRDCKRALILTGKSLNTKTDVVKKVQAALGDRYVASFDKIGQHAPVEAIEECLQLMKSEKIDLIVSVGGGSPIDSAKALSHMLHEETNPGNDDPRTFVPSIAVPTTLSVAETTQNAGFTKDGKKTGVSHPALVPRTIILDGELTLSTPEKLWLSSGMRAVDHAIESLYRPGDFNWLLKNQYLGALRDLFPLLRASKANANDVDARQRLQVAVITSLFPEARRGALGLSHSLGHALGSTYQIGHGITSCLTLPAAIRYTAQQPAIGSVQLAALADALSYIAPDKAPLQVRPSTDVEANRRRGLQVAEEVQTLIKDLGLATTLSECGVPAKDYEAIAAHVNPKKDPQVQKDIEQLLQSIA